MLPSMVIVFREVLEAGLVIGIMLAATKGVVHRGWWVGGGILVGIMAAGVIAGFADTLAQAFAGVGQEVFNAAVLGLAVVMLGWHTVWMAQHGRELAGQVRSVGRAVSAGERALSVVGVVIAVAVLREGAEVVLFLYGIAGGGSQAAEMAVGSAFGIALGAGVAALLYFGLLRIPTRRLFTVTSWLIILLAAGMASQAVGMLIQAGIVPPLIDPLWDSSGILADSSLIGIALQTLVGYVDRPAAAQLVAYGATLLVIIGAMRLARHDASHRPAPAR
jgi:high-affinity iron transporter